MMRHLQRNHKATRIGTQPQVSVRAFKKKAHGACNMPSCRSTLSLVVVFSLLWT